MRYVRHGYLRVERDRGRLFLIDGTVICPVTRCTAMLRVERARNEPRGA